MITVRYEAAEVGASTQLLSEIPVNLRWGGGCPTGLPRRRSTRRSGRWSKPTRPWAARPW